MLPEAARPMPPLTARGEVGDDVAEQVVGDDHVETARVGHHVDGGGVDVLVAVVTSGNSPATSSTVRCHSEPAKVSTLFLCTRVRCLRRACAVAKA